MIRKKENDQIVVKNEQQLSAWIKRDLRLWVKKYER